MKDYLSPDVLERYGARADQSDGGTELTVGDGNETNPTDVPEPSAEGKQVARWEIVW